MSTDLARRGRNAKTTGDEWEREWIRDFHDATGIKLSRQLRERREGNIGDIEIHDQVPLVMQCRKRKKCSPFQGVSDAKEAAVTLGHNTHYPIAVLQKRLGVGGTNPRAIALYLEDWLEIIKSFDCVDLSERPRLQVVTRTGKTYPNLWAGLEEAQELVNTTTPGSIPVCHGFLKDWKTHSGYAMVSYWGFLKIMNKLYRGRIW